MILDELYDIILDRRDNPKSDSYTSSLVEQGEDAVIEKLGEEQTELLLAAKNDDTDEVIHESADVVYHLLVLLALKDVELDELLDELEARRR